MVLGKVFSEIARLRSSEIALVAGIRLLPGVSAHVSLEVRLLGGAVGAVAAGVRLLAGMRAHVVLHVVTVGRGIGTHGTLV